jgi:hypothetical protein
LRQRREVVTGTTGVDQGRGRNASQSNIGQRARERARKAGRSSDDAEVVERAGFRCVERDTAGNGFDTQRGAWGNAFAGQARCRNAGRKLRQAEARDADRRAAPGRHTACKVVGRAARRRNDGYELVGRKTIKETGCAVEPEGCRSGFDDRERAGCGHGFLPGAVPGIRNGSTRLPCTGTISPPGSLDNVAFHTRTPET